jgi:WD40 repeat protein
MNNVSPIVNAGIIDDYFSASDRTDLDRSTSAQSDASSVLEDLEGSEVSLSDSLKNLFIEDYFAKPQKLSDSISGQSDSSSGSESRARSDSFGSQSSESSVSSLESISGSVTNSPQKGSPFTSSPTRLVTVPTCNRLPPPLVLNPSAISTQKNCDKTVLISPPPTKWLWQERLVRYIFSFLHTEERVRIERVSHLFLMMSQEKTFLQMKADTKRTFQIRSNWQSGRFAVTKACFSSAIAKMHLLPSFNCLAIAHYDHSIRLLDLKSNTPVHTFLGHENTVYSLEGDGDFLVSAALQTILVWDVLKRSNWLTIRTRCLQPGIAVHGELLAYTLSEKLVHLINLRKGNSVCPPLAGPKAPISCLAMNEKHLVSGSDDKTIHVWDAQKRTLLHVLKDHTGKISNLSLYLNTLASACFDRRDHTVRVWNLEKGIAIRCLNRKKRGREVHHCELNLMKEGLLLGVDHSVSVWNVNNNALLKSMGSAHQDALRIQAVMMDSLLIVQDCNTLNVWDLQQNGNLFRVQSDLLPEDPRTSPILTADRSKLIVECGKVIQIYDFTVDREKHEKERKSNSVKS